MGGLMDLSCCRCRRTAFSSAYWVVKIWNCQTKHGPQITRLVRLASVQHANPSRMCNLNFRNNEEVFSKRGIKEDKLWLGIGLKRPRGVQVVLLGNFPTSWNTTSINLWNLWQWTLARMKVVKIVTVTAKGMNIITVLARIGSRMKDAQPLRVWFWPDFWFWLMPRVATAAPWKSTPSTSHAESLEKVGETWLTQTTLCTANRQMSVWGLSVILR